MISDEKMLLKVLEHGNTFNGGIYPSVCSTLNLQFFTDDRGEPVHTLGSLSFVVDICGTDLRLLFVENMLTEYFKYVEFYLCFLLRRGDLVGFYHHLKMLVRMEKGNEAFEERGTGDVCTCVSSGKYCINPSFNSVFAQKSDGVYNIFRHRFEYHLYTKNFLVPIPIREEDTNDGELVEVRNINGITRSVRMNSNLAAYFDMGVLSREVFEELPNFDFRWHKKVKLDEVDVHSDLSVHLNGKALGDVSFLMKLGKTLEFSLKFFNYI